MKHAVSAKMHLLVLFSNFRSKHADLVDLHFVVIIIFVITSFALVIE